MFAYRLEHSVLKAGPFQKGTFGLHRNMFTYEGFDALLELMYDISLSCTKPTWQEDVEEHELKPIMKTYGNRLLSGCADENTLEEWFDNQTVSMLSEYGFVIAKYKMDFHVNGKSNKQLIFVPMEETRKVIR